MNIINNHGTKINILGIPADRGRWLLIPLGMTILLCLGSVYSWSIFRTPLEKELGISASASLLPFTFILVFYAAVMPIAGFYIPRIGTRLMTAVGGMIVGLGYILSSFATNVTTLVLTYGVIAGIGVGIAYGVPTNRYLYCSTHLTDSRYCLYIDHFSHFPDYEVATPGLASSTKYGKFHIDTSLILP
jgi:hypothetical protein